MTGLFDFDARIGEPPRDDIGAVLAAAVQPLAQFFPTRRQDEDQDRVRKQPLDLQCALPVDLERHVVAVGDVGGDLGLRRAVEIAVHLRPLEEVAALDHAPERRHVDEVVLAAVLLAGARAAGRVRDAEAVAVGVLGEEALEEGGLAGARGAGDDDGAGVEVW